MSEQYIQREHRLASGELHQSSDCFASACGMQAGVEGYSEVDADGLCSVVPYVGVPEGEYYNDWAEADFVSANYTDEFDDYGLSPDFRGGNFSDDVMAIRDPNYRGGRYTPRASRGRGYRARSTGRGVGAYGQRRDSRYDSGDNFSGAPLERGKVQCHKCKLYGHFMRECREKPAGYLALTKPFATGAAETLAAVEAPVATNKGSNRNKNKNKNKNKTVTVAAVEEKPAEQLN